MAKRHQDDLGAILVSIPCQAESSFILGAWGATAPSGKVYSMNMADAAGPVERIHDRMLVIIAPKDYGRWLVARQKPQKTYPMRGKVNCDKIGQRNSG